MSYQGALTGSEFRMVLESFAKLAEDRLKLLIRRVWAHCKRSILDGSFVTGAPGQPWKTGELYGSWQDTGDYIFFSDLLYAPIIEDNLRGAQLRSPTGGFHSVKMTYMAFQLIVAHELEIVKRAIPDGLNYRGTTIWRDPATGRFA